MELTKKQFNSRGAEIHEWFSLPDPEFIQKVKEFEKGREDDNPTLGWTVGTRRSKTYLKVRRWVLAQVYLSVLYSCGINPCMKEDLDAVRGNLKQFWMNEYTKKYREFRLDSTPSEGKAKTIIGIARSKPERNGSIQVIDGAHRVIGMVANDIHQCWAYLGEFHHSFQRSG